MYFTVLYFNLLAYYLYSYFLLIRHIHEIELTTMFGPVMLPYHFTVRGSSPVMTNPGAYGGSSINHKPLLVYYIAFLLYFNVLFFLVICYYLYVYQCSCVMKTCTGYNTCDILSLKQSSLIVSLLKGKINVVLIKRSSMRHHPQYIYPGLNAKVEVILVATMNTLL